MLTPNHPDDELLAALAGRDGDAVADATLTAHVDACDRCTELLTELGALCASLAELPDLAPSRPLRLLPPVADAEPSAADRLTGWARRLFAPAVTAGAALALVGLVGTAAPALQGAASGPAPAMEELGASDGGGDAGVMSAEEPDAADGAAGDGSGSDGFAAGGQDEATDGATDRSLASRTDELPAERSPWPMILFTGVALALGALLLRWILVPRAG